MDEPVALLQWETVVGRLLDRTTLFPKSARFTFGARIDGRALDILEALTEARWASGPEKANLLGSADRSIAVLLALLRLAHDRRLLDHASHERLVRDIDEIGRMVGGWRRSIRP